MYTITREREELRCPNNDTLTNFPIYTKEGRPILRELKKLFVIKRNSICIYSVGDTRLFILSSSNKHTIHTNSIEKA